eukprot:UN0688
MSGASLIWQVLWSFQEQRICICALACTALCGVWYACGFLTGPSPQSFYGYTKRGRQAVCGVLDADSFVEAFSRAPQKVQFRFIGHHPDVVGIGRYLRPFSQQTVSAFDVALDLAPFVSSKACVDPEQRYLVEQFLATGNVLEALRIQKTVTWDGWEELAGRVQQRLHELGFSGRVEALLECDEQILVCRNHPWSNLLRSWIVQVILILSVVGGCILAPYMWARAKHLPVKFRFHIEIEPVHYWELIRVGIHAGDSFHVK